MYHNSINAASEASGVSIMCVVYSVFPMNEANVSERSEL